MTWQHNESLFAPLVTRLQKRPAALNNLLFHLLHWRQLRIGRRRFTQISLCLQVGITAWHEHDGGRQAQAACPRTHQFHSMALAGARTHGQACSPVRAHTTVRSGPGTSASALRLRLTMSSLMHARTTCKNCSSMDLHLPGGATNGQPGQEGVCRTAIVVE